MISSLININAPPIWKAVVRNSQSPIFTNRPFPLFRTVVNVMTQVVLLLLMGKISLSSQLCHLYEHKFRQADILFYFLKEKIKKIVEKSGQTCRVKMPALQEIWQDLRYATYVSKRIMTMMSNLKTHHQRWLLEQWMQMGVDAWPWALTDFIEPMTRALAICSCCVWVNFLLCQQ